LEGKALLVNRGKAAEQSVECGVTAASSSRAKDVEYVGNATSIG